MSGVNPLGSGARARKPLTPDLPFRSSEGLTPLRPEPPAPAFGLAPLGPVDGLRTLPPERLVPPGTAAGDGMQGEVLLRARRRAAELDWAGATDD